MSATAGRYQLVHTKMWASGDFLSLSPPKPNARDCWIHLLTGRHSTSIPGLFSAGPAALAEDCHRWPVAAWLKCFGEIEAAKMAVADWDARVVFLPNALIHRRPENPNVVKGWKKHATEIPDCALKRAALSRLRVLLGSLPKGESLVSAFDEALGNPFERVTGTFEEPWAQGTPRQYSVLHTQEPYSPKPPGDAPGPMLVAHEPADPPGRPTHDQIRIAYAKGIGRATAAPCIPPTHADEGRALEQLWEFFGSGKTPVEFLAWLATTAAEYVEATRKDARFQKGFAPTKCVQWLNTARAKAAESPPPRRGPPVQPGNTDWKPAFESDCSGDYK